MAIDLRGVAGLQDLAFPHADGAAAEQQRFRRLGGGIDEDRAGGLEDARQFGAQFLAQLVVEIGERLVQQHQIGALDQRARDRGALLLAAGQLQRRALQIRLERSSFGRFLHPLFDLGARLALHAQRRGDVLVDRERGIVDELLIDHRHRALRTSSAGDVLAVDQHAAGGRLVEPASSRMIEVLPDSVGPSSTLSVPRSSVSETSRMVGMPSTVA
jgi:hypothetical protein